MRLLVETAAGTVRGLEHGGVRVFKGVSYGDGTSGSGRFRPASDPRPWPGVRDCLDDGPSCPQISIEKMIGIAVPAEAETYMGVWCSERSTSEDCLVLNVWTPTSDRSAKLPVVVWLHGGGISTGSASWPLSEAVGCRCSTSCMGSSGPRARWPR
jgi:para-nitrobenzyl esterase